MNRNINKIGMQVALIVMMACLNFVQFELCDGNSLGMSLKYICMNIGILVCLYIACYAITCRIYVTILFCNIITAVLSVLNYYVIQFRGTPVSTKDLKNLGTAMTVIENYKIVLDKRIVVTLIIFALSIFVAGFSKRRFPAENRSWRQYLLRLTTSIVLSGAFLYVCFFAKWSLKPKNTFGWSWEESYHRYGYLAESLEIIEATLTTVQKPEGYSNEERIQILDSIETSTETAKNAPNIIFILNESWYDLETIVDIDCDQELTPYINSTDNAIRGYSVVPNIGTNLSEYEYLTGNSLQLMQGITPFNSLNMSGAESIVSVLKKSGYYTTAMHPAVPTNYSRNIAYPAMGFDEILFQDDFSFVELYGDRPQLTDSAAYQTLIEQFEKNRNAGPQFLYLLTIQNHGGWDVNDKQYDTVTIQNDFGPYKEMTEEYLSCLQLTDLAWKELTEYFSQIEEPTIICMVGDHAPSFADTLSKYWSNYSDEELAILLNATPYIIWSNDSLDTQELGTISMNYFAALVLQMAGIQTDAFYNNMADMYKEVPVLSSFNLYIAADGTQYQYSDNNKYSEMLREYFVLEYGRIK